MLADDDLPSIRWWLGWADRCLEDDVCMRGIEFAKGICGSSWVAPTVQQPKHFMPAPVSKHHFARLGTESEDFPFSKPTAKLVRTVDGKPPAPKQRANPSEAIAKSAEKATVSSQDPSETTAVRSVMQRQPSYCFENQSVDEVRKIMRELHLQYLVVLDEKMRVVGTDGRSRPR